MHQIHRHACLTLRHQCQTPFKLWPNNSSPPPTTEVCKRLHITAWPRYKLQCTQHLCQTSGLTCSLVTTSSIPNSPPRARLTRVFLGRYPPVAHQGAAAYPPPLCLRAYDMRGCCCLSRGALSRCRAPRAPRRPPSPPCAPWPRALPQPAHKGLAPYAALSAAMRRNFALKSAARLQRPLVAPD